MHEEKRDMKTSFEYIDPDALGVRYVNRDPDGRYSLTKEMICDPHHGVVLQSVRLEGREDLMPRLKVYALLAPHLDGGGAGNSARAMDLAGHKVLLAWKNEWSLAMTASCGFTRDELRVCGRERRLAGPDAELADGLGVWVGDERQCRADGRDRPGMQRAAGERAGGAGDAGATEKGTDGKAVREFTLAIGIGEGHHTAAQKTMGSLAMPFAEQRKAVHRAVAAGGASGVAGREGAGWRQADARQPRGAAGA